MNKDLLQKVSPVYPLKVDSYEQYISDTDNTSSIEKINAMIQNLHHMGRLTNNVVIQWNEVMKWIVENGIETITTDILNEKLDIALNTDLRVLTETVADEKIAELVASGQFEVKIETAINSMHENIQGSLNDFNVKLAETAENSVKVLSFIDISQHDFILNKNVASQNAALVTSGIKNAIQHAKNTSGSITFNRGDYRVNEPIVFVSLQVMGENSVLHKDHNGVGFACTGGASYTIVNDIVIEGYGSGRTSDGVFVDKEHGICIFNNRVKLKNVRSSFHKGHGFLIGNYSLITDYSNVYPYVPPFTGNMNKSYFDIDTSNNNGRGVQFEGDRDDSSVWDIKVISSGNFLGGIYSTPTYMGRNWKGFMYSENDAKNATEHSIFFEKLRASELWVYSEGQSNPLLDEIRLGEFTNNLKVFSARNNRDNDFGSSNQFAIGQGVVARKLGDTRSDSLLTLRPFYQPLLFGLADKPYRYADEVFTVNDLTNVKRSFGVGGFWNMLYRNTEKTGRLSKETSESITHTFSKDGVPSYKEQFNRTRGTIETPTDIIVGDIIHSTEYQAQVSGFARPAFKVDVVAETIASGKVGTRIDIYTKDNGLTTYPPIPTVSINQSGQVSLSNLAGVGNTITKTNANGRLMRGSDTIATSIDGATDLASLKSVLKTILT